MGRYERGKYGTAKYGLDLWSEYSVEPMLATLEVDQRYWGGASSSFTDINGQPVYNRVQVSWLEPSKVDDFRLIRSNLGFPTSPNDPFASVVFTYQDDVALNTAAANHGDTVVPLDTDPYDRRRLAYLDTQVEPGREYFYAIWVYLEAPDEWIRAGEVSVITSNDHQTLETFKSVMPAYMWNQYSGPGDGVAVDRDDDDENVMGRWLQSNGWVLDKSLTKIDLLREVWDPQKTPSALLDDAVRNFGLPVEPALGAKAQRSLLANAAYITGERGTLSSVSLLIESLTGFACPAEEPTIPFADSRAGYPADATKGGVTVGKNIIGTTDESSFEGLMVDNSVDLNVVGGTGRWFFENATLKRVDGDVPNAAVNIARDANPDDDFGPSSRFGIRMDAVSSASPLKMSLGENVQVTKYVAGPTYAEITTKWQHGLEAGDVINLRLDGSTYTDLAVLSVSGLFGFRVAAPVINTTITPTIGHVSGAAIRSYQGILVKPGAVYSLVGKFKGANRSDIWLRMKYYDRFGNYLSTVEQKAGLMTPSVTIPPTTWTAIYIAGSSPANAAVATLEIEQETNASGGQYLSVDSLMVAEGGTPYESGGTYDSGSPYDGVADYSFEDSRLLTINIDAKKNSNGQSVPTTVQADLLAIIEARLVAILAAYLPIGTAFVVKIATT
jgi:phage tail-like protein